MRREPDADDRRAARVEATAAGLALHERIRAQRRASLAAHLDDLPDDEVHALLAALPALEALAEGLAAVRVTPRVDAREPRRARSPHLRGAREPELPPLVRGPGHLAGRDVDADDRAGLAGLTLTGSGTALGLVVAVQMTAGAVARTVRRRDRRSRRQAPADDRWFRP